MNYIKYKVFCRLDDMGSYVTTAQANATETAYENALWDINSARRHDGLPEMTIGDLRCAIMDKDIRFVRIDE